MIERLRRLFRLPETVAELTRQLVAARQELDELRRDVETVRDDRVPRLEARGDDTEKTLGAADRRVQRLELRLDAGERQAGAAQTEFEGLRDERLGDLDGRIGDLEVRLDGAETQVSRFGDEVVPALVDRDDVLNGLLLDRIDEVGSLVDRMLLGEPLPAPPLVRVEDGSLPDTLTDVQGRLLAELRGDSGEITHRLGRWVDAVRDSSSILDLGCGRGEWLLVLRESGVAAKGVESDLALVQGALRRGLDVVQGDVLEHLRELPEGSLGAITAFHLFEHLPTAVLGGVLAEVRRVLEPGGLILVEMPNAHSLRVGASLFWIDPTHARPLLPETLSLLMRAAGLEVDEPIGLHPFEEEQSLSHAVRDAVGDVSAEMSALVARLDELILGHRDVAVLGRRPQGDS